MSRYDLLVVGEINPDLILSGPDLVPRFGQVEKLVDGADLVIGSSSVIMACAASRLGLRTAFVGVVGDDPFGRFMLEAMRAREVDTTHCITDPATATGLSVILSRGPDRAILTYLGAISSLRVEQIDVGLLRQARHLHVGGYFLLQDLRPDLPDLFGRAQEEGLTTSLDTNWDPADEWSDGLQDVLRHTNVLLPNDAEAERMGGGPDLETSLDSLSRRVEVLAVKMGADGGRAIRGGTEVRASALEVELVDTTGAGDTFDAGFLFGYLNGWGIEEALRLACACGSLSTRAAGGTAAQPTLEEAIAASGVRVP